MAKGEVAAPPHTLKWMWPKGKEVLRAECSQRDESIWLMSDSHGGVDQIGEFLQIPGLP